MILSAYESKEGILTVITARLCLMKPDVETVPYNDTRVVSVTRDRTLYNV